MDQTIVLVHSRSLFRFMSMVKDPSHFIPLIVPVVVSRLGTNEITEPSEELR